MRLANPALLADCAIAAAAVFDDKYLTGLDARTRADVRHAVIEIVSTSIRAYLDALAGAASSN
jgi:hypothetical protein